MELGQLHGNGGRRLRRWDIDETPETKVQNQEVESSIVLSAPAMQKVDHPCRRRSRRSNARPWASQIGRRESTSTSVGVLTYIN